MNTFALEYTLSFQNSSGYETQLNLHNHNKHNLLTDSPVMPLLNHNNPHTQYIVNVHGKISLDQFELDLVMFIPHWVLREPLIELLQILGVPLVNFPNKVIPLLIHRNIFWTEPRLLNLVKEAFGTTPLNRQLTSRDEEIWCSNCIFANKNLLFDAFLHVVRLGIKDQSLLVESNLRV